MTAIDDKDILRCRATVRSPFSVEFLPLLSRLHSFAFRVRRRGLAKRLVGKPSKFLFKTLMAAGMGGTGRLRVETGRGPRAVTFNARNTQFCALYMAELLPVYELDTSAVLDRLVGNRDLFFDIGANWGWYSVMIAARPSFAGAVHAFEPFPSTFVDLKRMAEETGLQDLIHCHQIALAASEGQTAMTLPDGLHSGLATLGGAGGVKVRCAPLDGLDLPLPKVMKLDVEDHEMDVLLGAAAVITKARPFIVLENGLHPDRPALTLEPLRYLIKAGYTLFYSGWTHGDPDLVMNNPGYFTPGSDAKLALVPFLPAQRAVLPPLLNIVAAPSERLAEFSQCFR